ncbi:type II secretion system F family protein [Phycicoccus sp. BSK3Z-2]|uniref:Type II secretion system F family protein n=1 Tax=Phycicoccus avicenniae TaxID=2828860 RepID=A0A941D9D6_9MICO|nr:type II secretion system F family protein [Phycicoccus avicenniae]MBR7743906.1 type II secretion system F family protein [Phycicoccus avicenniae]
MTRRPGAVRAAVVALLAGGTALFGAPVATADVPATLSDVRVGDDAMTATLVLRAGAEQVELDPSSVSVTIGGRAAEVDVAPAERTKRSSMLVIDTSGSMTASGMATVRTAVRDFLEVVPDDVQVGVVSFATTSGVDVAPTTDHDAILSAVGALRSKGETSLYRAVQDAVQGLGTEGERSIVLLSDGADSVSFGEGGEARERSERQKALEALAQAKVRAEAISFQTEAADVSVLQQFADAGGGTVARAVDRDAVASAFEAAARALDSQAGLDITIPAGVSGVQPVVVTGRAGAERFQLTESVDLQDTEGPVVVGGGQPAQAAVPPIPGLSALNLPLLLVATGVVFLGVFALGVALAAPKFQSTRSRRIEAVEAYGYGTSRAAQRQQQQTSTAALTEQILHVGDKVVEGRESTTKTMELLVRADLPWRAGEWFLLRLVAAVIVGALGALFLDGWFRLAGLLVGALAGFVVPSVVLRILAARRARKFESILPDILTLVATSLSSGFSLPQALDSVARDAAEPCAKEFSRALAATRIGTDVSDALDQMAERMDSSNMRWTTLAIRIQREVGGNLAETLRTTAATLREREGLRRHVRALSAEGRLSAYILIALPIGLFFYMLWVNFEYVSLLWTTFLGIGMVGIGLVMLVIGIIWMRKVVEIEV